MGVVLHLTNPDQEVIPDYLCSQLKVRKTEK
jgi:hypothetical protein